MKRLLLVVVIIFIASSLLGCGMTQEMTQNNPEREKEFSVQLLDKGEGGIETIDFETISPYGSFISTDALETVTVSFDGNTYTGTYRTTNHYPGTNLLIDEYYVDDSSLCSSFEVSREDQTLLGIDMVGGQEFFASEFTRPILSEEEIEQRAVSWASKWILMDGYSSELDFRKGSEEASCPDLYCYRFCSIAQGIETTDYLDVLVSDRGTFYWMHALQPGWTKDHRAELLNFDVKEAIEQAKVASKLTNPVIGAQRFGLTEEGKVCLMVFLTGSDDEVPLLLGVSQE